MILGRLAIGAATAWATYTWGAHLCTPGCVRRGPRRVGDREGVERARAIAKRFDAGLAIVDKRREGPNSAVAMHLIGEVKGRDAIVIDDIIDTGGTLVQAVSAVEREGARRILACGVHAVLSGPALERIKASPIEEVVVTNSIPVSDDKRNSSRITVLTVAPLLGEAIRRIHDEESVSTLFL